MRPAKYTCNPDLAMAKLMTDVLHFHTTHAAPMI